jgi:hypothetical protein
MRTKHKQSNETIYQLTLKKIFEKLVHSLAGLQKR